MRGSAAAASTRTGKRKSQRCMAGSFSQVDGEMCAILHLCVKKRSTFAILSHCVSGKYVRAMVSSPICRRGCASRFVRAGDRLVRETEKSRLFHHASRLPACAGAPWFPPKGIACEAVVTVQLRLSRSPNAPHRRKRTVSDRFCKLEEHHPWRTSKARRSASSPTRSPACATARSKASSRPRPVA